MPPKRKQKTIRNWGSKLRGRELLIGATLVVAVLLVWAASTTQNNLAESARTDIVGTNPGEIAPDFSLVTLEGNSYNLMDDAGKPRIVFFIAYWCGTCIPEAEALNQVRQEYGEAVEIIVIDVDPSSTPELLSAFKEWTGDGDFVWGFDHSQEITNTYRVRSLDTTLIINKDGYIVYKDEHPTRYETFAQILSDLDL